MLHLQTKRSLCEQVSQKTKKLVAILVTSILITGKKREEELEWVPYIQYPVTFKNQTEALLDSESEVNVMNPAFVSK